MDGWRIEGHTHTVWTDRRTEGQDGLGTRRGGGGCGGCMRHEKFPAAARRQDPYPLA